MFGVPFIVCLCATILRTEGSPIFESEYNVTDATSTESSPALICEQNAVLAENSSLYELLNHDQFWFILARSKFVYGEQTWNNVLMQTSTIDNETVHLTFTGEDRNGTCVSSEKGRIASSEKTNRVAVHWPTQEGFLDMVYIDSTMIHFILCYSIDSNATSLCAHNQSEQFVVNNSPAPGENDTMLWLKSHCSAVNADDFIVNDDPKKCVPVVVPPVIIVVNGSEPTAEEMNGTVSQIVIGDQGNVTVITITELESTTRANRTNRLEILEEYYNNATKNETSEESMEEAATMEMKPIVLLSANVSAIEGIDRINVTFVEQNGKTSEPATNETVAEESSSTVVHETKPAATTEIGIEPLNSTGHPSTSIPESSNVTDVQTTKHTPIAVTTEKEFSTEPNTSPVVEHSSTAEHKTSPVITEIATTTESTTPATTIPADCPPLEGCPFEYCAFARKLDNRGCPTCNCLQSNKSNITCPASACQPCLYGHYTDSNGCPVCQCQSRPYPPLGERCPVLQCEPCYFGTVKDEYNCDTCICIRPNNQECPVLACPFGPCKYGSLKDEDDCATCDCLLPSTNVTKVNCSTPVSCAPCHLGYVRNADGCQTCQCKLRGSVPCGSVASQCHCDYGAYLDSDGCETCSCLPDPKNASRQACWELSNHANFYNLSGPICSPDGSFYARQCDKSRCWCVTPSGLHISNFESHPNESVNCACAVEQYQVSSLRMIGHHLLCLLSGNYAPIQCDGRYCSCVDENGKAIGPSVSAQNRNELRCVGVYQQLHPERFIVHRSSVENTKPSRSPHGMPTSLCLEHLEQVRHANVTDEHILIPVCDGNGLYAAVQCDQNERYCWCVDKKTGVEMDGTRRLNARPNCNAA